MPPTATVPLKTSKKKLLLLGLAALFTLGIVGAAIAYWVVMPRVAENMVRAQLDRVADRIGLEFETGSIRTAGFEGVIIDSFRATLPGEAAPFLTIDELRVSVALKSVLAGNRAIGALTVSDLELTLHRRADGSLNTDFLQEKLRGDEDEPLADEQSDDDTDDGPSWLRHFGGSFPDITVHRAALLFISDKADEPWPVRSVRTEEALLKGSRQGGEFTTHLAIDATEGATRDFQLPETIEIALNLRLPLTQSTGTLEFLPGVQIAHLGPLPFLRGGIKGIVLKEGPEISLTGLSLDVAAGTTLIPLAEVQSLALRLADFPRSRDTLRIVEIEATGPVAYLEFSEGGANTLDTLRALVSPAAPGHVISSASSVAAAIAASKEPAPAEVEDAPPALEPPSTGLRASLANLDWKEIIPRHAPNRVDIREARLDVRDRRVHETLMRSSAHFSFEDMSLSVVHRPLKSELAIETSFNVLAGADDGRGDLALSLTSNYRTGKLDIDATADAVDLGWVSQLGGPRVTDKLRGGVLRARLELARPTREGKADFSAMLAMSNGNLYLRPVAEEPLTNLNGSYQIEGFYHPTAPIPAPRHIKAGKVSADSELLDIEPETAVLDPALPPTRGAFVITKGTARLNQVAASVKPALYGLDGFNRMPARIDLAVGIERTPLSDIIDAIPPPMMGPLEGIKMRGHLTWDYELEVPLYEASQMEWKADVKLDGFEIAHLPPAVNVFKLVDEFEHTIEDRFHPHRFGVGEPVDFTRTIKIPAMRPTPATWLLDNTNLTLQQIDRQRRRRGWPVLPEPYAGHGLSAELLRSPDYWISDHALSQAAPKPWRDVASSEPTFNWPFTGGETEAQKEGPKMGRRDDPDRYGKYQFVPLHHISPFMPRAIMTTEDNSFFTHSGFNWLAIRQSVQSNLRARSYVRGASTISMQLAKNLYLDRSKVLSRKLQEVALVWLMESVADVPKERLMEIYLNIIEFGPGIYGIHDASVHYFGKRPDKLDISEVAWLVSIVPSPKRHHIYYERGEITDSWFRRMTRYIRVMYNRERISEAEYQQAIQIKPTFYKPEEGDPLFRAEAPKVKVDIDIEGEIEESESQRPWPGFRDFFP